MACAWCPPAATSTAGHRIPQKAAGYAQQSRTSKTCDYLACPLNAGQTLLDPMFDCTVSNITLIYCCLLPSYAGPIAAGGLVDRRGPRRPGTACMAAASVGCAVQHKGVRFRGAGRLGRAAVWRGC